jgi:hypothetical protein
VSGIAVSFDDGFSITLPQEPFDDFNSSFLLAARITNPDARSAKWLIPPKPDNRLLKMLFSFQVRANFKVEGLARYLHWQTERKTQSAL